MSAAIDSLTTQAEKLCGLHDHITRVITRLEIPGESFSDRYPHPNKATFGFEPIAQMFLYQYARGFTEDQGGSPHPFRVGGSRQLSHNRMTIAGRLPNAYNRRTRM